LNIDISHCSVADIFKAWWDIQIRFYNKLTTEYKGEKNCENWLTFGEVADKSVGFVAAAVSMPMGGCRARRPVDGRSLMSAETVGIIVAAEPAVH